MQIKNYSIIRSLERNTLSELFLARHVHENYYVKVRLYDQQSITNEEVREAILQRLRNSYQMRHRNIIATLDYGTEGRYMYQIQEHMDHGTLEDLLEKTHAVPPEIAAFILQEMLRGLQYAHSIGIFHGMLNPSRILFSANGVVKVDDFQFLDLRNTFLKQVNTRIKARQQMYLAPEHLLGKEADHRCDLFSAGVITYKMLTGKHPFLEELAEWTTMQIVACNPTLLFELDPTLPPPFEELVEKMIEKEPAKRTQSAEETLRVLDGYMDHFGEVRSYEVLGSFLKKPQQSVEQLNLLRVEEFLQQAAQFQLQEQWDRALLAYSRAHHLKPKVKSIENEIKSIHAVRGYVAAESKDPKFAQLEQSLKTSPDNIQILQRLATLAKSRGDLIKSITYYKRILKVHPHDPFASTQLKHLLQTDLRDSLLSPNDVKWTRWQDFYRKQDVPFWQRPGALQGNIPLMAAVFVLTILICGLQFLNLVPRSGLEARPAALPSVSNTIVAVRQMESVYERASAVYQQGSVDQAIHLLAGTPLVDKGSPAARVRLLLAKMYVESGNLEQSLRTLDMVDLPSADFEQKVAVFKMKGELYRRQGLYGRAIDQYIDIKALPGLPKVQSDDVDATIQSIQDEALQQSRDQNTLGAN
jgi:serine/threonine protein kinase